MSCAVFDYSKMEKAADHAQKSADKLNDYRDELDRKITKKLRSYSGKWTAKVSSAATMIRNKQQALENKANGFITYSISIRGLINQCKSTDVAVKGKISSLTKDFTSRHGIKISNLEYRMMLNSVSRSNSSLPARWLNDKADQFDSWLGRKGRDFVYWYKYEGGKYAIWENVKALLKAAVAVLSVVAAAAAFMAAPLTGGSTLILAAGIFAGFMTLFDAGTDAYYNCKAASAAARGDPVLAKRLDDVDDYTDALRRESDSRFLHDYTHFLDITETAATVVTLVSSIKSIATKGYKWITDGTFEVKDFKWKSDFKFSDLKTGIAQKFNDLKTGISDFGRALKAGDTATLRSTFAEIKDSWKMYAKQPFKEAKDGIDGFKKLKNLNSEKYWKGLKDWTGGAKFFVEIPKSLFDEGGIKDYFTGIIFSGFAVGGDDPKDLEDFVTLDDIKSKFIDKLIKIGKSTAEEISYQVNKGNSKQAASNWRNININVNPVQKVTVGGTTYGAP